MEPVTQKSDVIVVGAGVAGIYSLCAFNKLGLSVQGFEKGGDVGGTWYWTRYPGARCDIASLQYSFSFDEKLQQEWKWSEKYSTAGEIKAYLSHVTDRFNVRQFISFNTTITKAEYSEVTNTWQVWTNKGDLFSAQFLVMATGCLSTFTVPKFKGLETFKGRWFHTGQWPHEEVDFTGKKVAIVGTGSSGIQSIPKIAAQAAELHVFQRTANFSIPGHNRPANDEDEEVKKNYAHWRDFSRKSGMGLFYDFGNTAALSYSPEEREKLYEERWQEGGFHMWNCFNDLFTSEDANNTAAEFVHSKIRGIVKDAQTAELLCPKDYPFGTKRLCVDTDYYATYNRENVKLIDIKSNPIEQVTGKGIKLQGGEEYQFDVIVFATGYDAMTGSLNAIDIRGNQGQSLKEKWVAGPRTLLGLMSNGFPNFFIITGPQSPSVFVNMTLSTEQHVEWIADLFAYMRKKDKKQVDATLEAENEWVDHCNTIAVNTLYPKANSWYLGANIPGKPRIFMPYIGGGHVYRKKCDDVAARGYDGFNLV